jgi:hypothetical protein
VKLFDRLFVLALIIGATVPATSGHQSLSPNSMEGVWQITEITTVNRDGKTRNSEPQPGLFIFTRSYYSAVWTPSTGPRPPYADRWRPTDEEKVKAYDSIVVNTGTYELTETELITRPIIARVPGFGGGTATYKYKLDGDDLFLEMVEEYSGDGIRATWLDRTRFPLKLVRVE